MTLKMKQQTVQGSSATQIQLYPSTAFFTGFRASVSADTATNQQMHFYEGEKLVITDTSDPDYWTAVPASNSARYGQIHRRYVMVEDVRLEPWFFQELPTTVATAALKRQGPGSFLLRTQKKKFLLSHMSDRNVYHTWIHQSESGRYYVDSRRRFSTIQELVDFCRRNRVNGMRIEKYPTKRSIEDLWRTDLKLEEFKCQREVSAGHFPWTIRFGNFKSRGHVALHTLKKSALLDDENWFRRQCDILMCLENDNLVQLTAVCDQNEKLTLALRLGSTETLADYLNANGPRLLSTAPEVLVTIGSNISSGMAYLEKRGIVHNELIAENCWVEEGTRHVRIGGFHFARFEDHPYTLKPPYPSRVILPAPELLDGQSSIMSDVWAYGLLLWRIFVGTNDKSGSLTLEKVMSRKLSNLPSDVADLVENIISSCLYEVAQIRPTFVDLQRRFKRYLEQGQNDISQPSIEVDPVLFGIETFELPEDETLNESNTYFDGEKENDRHENHELDFHELTEKSSKRKSNEDSFWNSDDPFDSGSPEFDVTKTTAKRQLSFENEETPKTGNGGNYVSSDSGCSLSQNNLRRIRSVGDEYQNLRTLCKTYREMFESAKTENDALQRRVDELERRKPIGELERQLENVENEFKDSQRECKRLRDRNKMLERSFCQQCRGYLNSEKTDVKDNAIRVTSEGRVPSVLSVESGGTIKRAMTQFERENAERRERLRALRVCNSRDNSNSNPLNGSFCGTNLDDTLPTYEDDVTSAITSLDFDHVDGFCAEDYPTVRRQQPHQQQQQQLFLQHPKQHQEQHQQPLLQHQQQHPSSDHARSHVFDGLRQHSDDSAVDFGSSRTDSCDSDSFRSRKLTHEPEVRAAQKLIRDNLQHNYLTSHSHISTIADDGVSKVTLF